MTLEVLLLPLTLVVFMFVDEESAFWLLATLCEEMCPAYYSRSMNGAQADTMLLAELVELRLPTLHAHFEKV